MCFLIFFIRSNVLLFFFCWDFLLSVVVLNLHRICLQGSEKLEVVAAKPVLEYYSTCPKSVTLELKIMVCLIYQIENLDLSNLVASLAFKRVGRISHWRISLSRVPTGPAHFFFDPSQAKLTRERSIASLVWLCFFFCFFSVFFGGFSPVFPFYSWFSLFYSFICSFIDFLCFFLGCHRFFICLYFYVSLYRVSLVFFAFLYFFICFLLGF